MSFMNSCNLLANVYPPNSESMPISEHNLEALQQQQQQQQQQHAFSEQQQPNFEDNNHICEEPAKKQKVATTESLSWDSSVSEKPATCNETATILGLNTAWSAESVSATANALMAQMRDSSNFVTKVTAVQQAEQEHVQQQQGMWHFPPHGSSTAAVNQADPQHQNSLASNVASNEENSKWETIDAKPMTEELQATQALQGVNGIKILNSFQLNQIILPTGSPPEDINVFYV